MSKSTPMPDEKQGHGSTPRFDRAGALERSIKSLSRALEMHDGSVAATKSALWEVESVKRLLPKIEASLRGRLKAIDLDPLGGARV